MKIRINVAGENFSLTRCWLSIVLPLRMLFSFESHAQKDFSEAIARMKQLSIEDLMNIDVMGVSRTPEKITTAASAIQVISGEEIAGQAR
ncbi:MAG: hypothetical protein ABIS01_07495 [Ferruginibacter sp.]